MILLACIVPIAGVHAQTGTNLPAYIPIDDEAPRALIDTRFGDAGVSLFLYGFWDMYLSGSIGLLFEPGIEGPLFRTFPGMASGGSFRQIPDLALFLLIDERFSFEASFIDGYELNRFVLGYDGLPAEPLKSVRIGNADIDFGVYGSYPLIPFGDVPSGSIGAGASFELGKTSHELAIRFQPAGSVHSSYIGMNLVIRQEIHPSDFAGGRFFILPDSGVSNVEVFVETVSANATFQGDDGKFYREASGNEVIVSEVNGSIRFTASLPGRAVVYYEKDGASVGDSSLGRSALPGTDADDRYLDARVSRVDFEFGETEYLGTRFSRYRVSDGVRKYLLIYSPGTFSPFEDTSYYPVPIEIPGIDTDLRVSMDGLVHSIDAPDLDIDLDTGSDRRIVRISNLGSVVSNRGNFPFISEIPSLYGPNYRADRAGTMPRLILEILEPVERIELERPVAGSVRVYLNEVQEYRFTVDQSGVVDLGFTPGPSDRIEIAYTSNAASGTGTDSVLAYGSRIPIDDDTYALFSAGSFWNATPGTYSYDEYTHPGSFIATASLSHSGDRVSLDATAAVTVHSPDTSGIYRLLGSVSTTTSFPILSRTIYPAPLPQTSPSTTQLDNAHRGRLIYKDFVSYDVAGVGILNRYDWPGLTADRISDYTSGGVTGPYVASAVVDSRVVTVAAIDYELDADDTWTGAVFRGPDPSQTSDLSDFSGISFAWRATGSGEPDIYFQIGAIGEDLDGDGNLDAETSAESLGFLFDDEGSHESLRAGTSIETGNGSKDSEDGDANGILDRDDDANIVTRAFVSGDDDYPDDTEWKTVNIRFTESERRTLDEVRGIRIIIENTAAADTIGKLLLGAVSISGRKLAPSVESDSVIVSKTTDELLLDDLELRFPGVARRFNRNELREAVEVDFQNLSVPEPFSVITRISGARPREYRGVTFYVRGTESEVVLTLSDAFGSGISFAVQLPGDNAWHEASFEYVTGTVRLDGEPVSSVGSVYDQTAGELVQIEIGVSPTAPGRIYLDEIHLHNSRLYLGAGGDIEARIQFPGTILGIGDTPLLSNVSIEQAATAATAGFSPVSADSPGENLHLRTNLDATIGPFRTKLFFDTGIKRVSTSMSGGHDIRFPARSSPVTIDDRFSTYGTVGSRGYSRENGLDLSVPRVGTLSVAARIDSLSDTFEQAWNAAIAISPVSWFALAASFSANQFGPSFRVNPVDHFTSLADSYGYLVPSNESDLSRTVTFAGKLNAGPERVRIEIDPDIRILRTRVQPSYTNIDLKNTITVPIRFTENGSTTLTLSEHRDVSLSYPSSFFDIGTISPVLFGMIGATFTELGNDAYLIDLPFSDGFQGNLLDRIRRDAWGYEKATYSDDIEVRLSRRAFSSIRTMFLPVSASVQVTRAFEDTLAGSTDTISGTGEIVWESINLFGMYGVHPTFDLFESDEYGLTLTTVVGDISDNERIDTSIDLSGNAAFFAGHTEFTAAASSVVAFGSMKGAAADFVFDFETDLGLSTRTDVKDGIRIPVIDVFIENDVYFIHSESLKGRWSGSNRGVYLLLSHQSVLHLADFGRITVSAGLGMQSLEIDSTDIRRSFNIGLEGGLSVRISL